MLNWLSDFILAGLLCTMLPVGFVVRCVFGFDCVWWLWWLFLYADEVWFGGVGFVLFVLLVFLLVFVSFGVWWFDGVLCLLLMVVSLGDFGGFCAWLLCVIGLLVWFCGCWLCVICVGDVGLGCVSCLFDFWVLG